MALNQGLTTVKGIVGFIQERFSKDETHICSHVLLAKTKAGKFVGSITWTICLLKDLESYRTVWKDDFNRHSLNFLLPVTTVEETQVVQSTLSRFMNAITTAEFANELRDGVLTGRKGCYALCSLNIEYDELTKHFQKFFEELPDPEDLVWETGSVSGLGATTPFPKQESPRVDEPEFTMNQHDLLEAVSSSIENKALPGAMWFVMLMDDREAQRPLTFLLTTRENDSNGIHHSISWTKSLDFVIDISKVNALKFMENFSNFITVLMEAKPEFFSDSSFTKIIKSFSNEWGFADDFIIALNVFFDERAMEPDYNPNEPIHWSYSCRNNDPEKLGNYNDLLFSRITNLLQTKEEPLTKSTEVAVSGVIDKISRLAPKPALWFGLSGHNRGESDSHSLAFLLTDRDDVSSAIGERNADFVLDISSLDKVDYLAKFGEFLHELMTNGMSGENFLWALTRVVFPVGLTKNETEKRLSGFFSKLGSPDQIQWEWGRNTNCTKTFGWYMDLDLDLLASPKAQRKGKAEADPFYEVRRSSGDNPFLAANEWPEVSGEQTLAEKAPVGVGIPDAQYGSCVLTTFKEAKVYFVDSLKSLQRLEYDLGRKDLVQSPKRDMENWFVYPEPRGKTIRLNNFDFVVVLGHGDNKSPYVPVIAHEAMHVVLSLCKQIGYDPLNEQEPAAYAMEYLVKQALGFFALNEGASRK